MNQQRVALIAGLCFAAFIVACTPETPAPADTLPGPENLLFMDNFSAPNTAWALFDTEEGAAYPFQGELYLEDRWRGISIYTHLVDQSWRDVVISTQLRQVEGTQNNWMGAICRQKDEENYYLFAISADGYYLILKVEDGLPTKLAGPNASDKIEAGRNTNVIQITCADTTLSLGVNDKHLVTRTDATFSEGNVALFADAVDGGNTTTVAFDTFTLSAP